MIKTICIAVIAAVLLNSPWIIEGANNNCAAIEQRAMHIATDAPKNKIERMAYAYIARAIRQSDGRWATTQAAGRWGIPAPLVCGFYYWKAVIAPPPIRNAKAGG